MSAITSDRLDELETLIPPDDLIGVVRVDTRDLRDFAPLIRIARAALAWEAERLDDIMGDLGLLEAVADARRGT